MSAPSTAPHYRGAAVGVLTVVVASLAHAWAGGGAPTGAHAALLGVVAIGVGGVATVIAGGVRNVLAVLIAGQLLSHLVLSGHDHGGAVSGALMLSAHVAAVMACAVLVAAASRLAAALSRAVRVLLTNTSPSTVEQAIARPRRRPDHLRPVFATSISHRGPPVGVS